MILGLVALNQRFCDWILNFHWKFWPLLENLMMRSEVDSQPTNLNNFDYSFQSKNRLDWLIYQAYFAHEYEGNYRGLRLGFEQTLFCLFFFSQ